MNNFSFGMEFPATADPAKLAAVVEAAALPSGVSLYRNPNGAAVNAEVSKHLNTMVEAEGVFA